MADYQVVRRISLGSHHVSTKRTTHLVLGEILSTPASLQVAKYPGDRGYYLLYFDAEGQELTDTYHENLRAALSQAEWEYGVQPHEWERVVEVGWRK